MKLEPSEIAAAARPMLAILVKMGIAHYIGGSLASSAHGASRSTIDADIVVDLDSDNVEPFFRAIDKVYHADLDTMRNAVAQRESFNIIHRESIIKIDVFVLRRYKYERQVMDRIEYLALDPKNPDERLPFCSVEDIILNKLMWYDMGGRVSERQWSDLLSVMKIRGSSLDHAYLEEWADYLDVKIMLWDALVEAGLRH